MTITIENVDTGEVEVQRCFSSMAEALDYAKETGRDAEYIAFLEELLNMENNI